MVAGDRTFAAGCDSSLHVIDIATGKEVGTPLDLGGQVGATPAVIGDMLYVGTMSQQVLAINWKKMDVVWRFEPERHKQAFYSSAAVTDKLVVVGGRNKKVHALDRNTGSETWSFDTKNRVDSSPVIVGNRVFVGSNDKYLYELDLQKGTERKKYLLEGEVTGSPAVSGNCLIIGAGDGTVYCFGAKR